MLTAPELRHLVEYDPETGVFTWRVARRGRQAGEVIGSFRPSNGYLYGQVAGFKSALHRLAWLYMHDRLPVDEIDHVNGVKTDNRLANLREATRAQNERNKALRKDSTSGFKGASWHLARRRWRACITHNGQHIHLGYFNTPEQAHAAYCCAAERLHGQFLRTA